jgi:DNA replication protein DnaC
LATCSSAKALAAFSSMMRRLADAILDRLVHNAYRIELKGESMRKGKTPPAEHED